jgi:DNA-binding LacI/PurR family transcriptional regulator
VGTDIPKYRMIARDIRQAIDDKVLLAGMALPSHSALVKKYNASVSTIRQAINYMAMQGWVKAEHGKGVFVLEAGHKPQTSMRSTTVGFAVFAPSYVDALDGRPISPWPSPTANSMVLHGAAEVLQQNSKELLSGLFPPEEDSLDRFDRMLQRVSGVLVYQCVNKQVLEIISSHPEVKAVLLGHPPDESVSCDGFSNVCADLTGAGFLGMQALAIHNHKTVAFVELLKGRPHLATLEGVRHACKQYGLELRYELDFHDFNEKQLAQTLAGDPECTGVLVQGDGIAHRVQRELLELGLEVPRDKSIVAIGGIPTYYVGQSHPMACVDLQTEELGREGARVLLSEQAVCLHKSIPVIFHRGDSLRML